jgi:hypothetical protein
VGVTRFLDGSGLFVEARYVWLRLGLSVVRRLSGGAGALML